MASQSSKFLDYNGLVKLIGLVKKAINDSISGWKGNTFVKSIAGYGTGSAPSQTSGVNDTHNKLEGTYTTGKLDGTGTDTTTNKFTYIDTTYGDAVAATSSTGTNGKSGLLTGGEKYKLGTIEEGAQVNTVTGVKGNSETSYRTGNVNITKANIGLGNVDNTSDANKPVSTATQTALNGKQNSKIVVHVTETSGVASADKTYSAISAAAVTDETDVVVEYGGVYYTLEQYSSSSNELRFSAIDTAGDGDAYVSTITIDANETVTIADMNLQALLTFDNSPTSSSSNPVKSGGVYTALAGKQATLVGSGTGQNIKTINSSSILGSGDISLVSDVKVNNSSVVSSHIASISAVTGIKNNGDTNNLTGAVVVAKVNGNSLVGSSVSNITLDGSNLKVGTAINTNEYSADDTIYSVLSSLNTKVNSATSSGLTREIVTSLPTTNISATTIYMILASNDTLNNNDPTTSSHQNANAYNEYMYINSAWERIGSTEVNLDIDAITNNEIDTAWSTTAAAS